MEDWHRVFDTPYWGVVYGSLAAVRHYEARGESGAIVNVGSFFGDRATPVQMVRGALQAREGRA